MRVLWRTGRSQPGLLKVSVREGGAEFVSAVQSIEPKKGQGHMKKVVLSAVAALAMVSVAAPAFAADMP
ncbi:MAG: hypothetical protein ACRECC_03665, partial [Pseudolabrys sp.]